MSATQELLVTMGAAHRGSMDMIRESLPGKEKHSALALSILRFVDKHAEISQGELGKILRRDPMTMSQAVRSLQNAGLVTSHADQTDRRVKRLVVTKKGHALSENIREIENKIFQTMNKVWGRARLNQFARDMSEFNQSLSQVFRG
ncbi:MAG: winged helix-turn-helix transcriptional regulator [Spirochaetales bacterium]|nr:winged helix-turn-helix transcriptional regulator [Leptospiraceae bacterium]MCP5481984.1 winged helix-turn-helix transcriptional regulator [Spirochaetales bacterium]MCP5486465.1 winged helix-turn-helix transcriptional regulator [Spirochaetales bacterium]